MTFTEADARKYDVNAHSLPSHALARLEFMKPEAGSPISMFVVRLQECTPETLRSTFPHNPPPLMRGDPQWNFLFIFRADPPRVSTLYECRRPATWAAFRTATFNAYETYRHLPGAHVSEFPAVLLSQAPADSDDESDEEEDGLHAPRGRRSRRR
jgi:hypothetical protein